uniref:BTB domain-containing protein n=1 Tax=Neolamprologus brichardi TaxID=32507 RepID=A0A3Q4G8V0_NEOBR
KNPNYICNDRSALQFNKQLMRAVGRFCDASLNVGDGVVFLAHRNILACFTELLQQSNMPSATEFCLQGCPSDGLELLLNFVYTGELKLDPHNLDRVQQAAASLLHRVIKLHVLKCCLNVKCYFPPC